MAFHAGRSSVEETHQSQTETPKTCYPMLHTVRDKALCGRVVLAFFPFFCAAQVSLSRLGIRVFARMLFVFRILVPTEMALPKLCRGFFVVNFLLAFLGPTFVYDPRLG